jgi:hypothetical protein
MNPSTTDIIGAAEELSPREATKTSLASANPLVRDKAIGKISFRKSSRVFSTTSAMLDRSSLAYTADRSTVHLLVGSSFGGAISELVTPEGTFFLAGMIVFILIRAPVVESRLSFLRSYSQIVPRV